MHIKTLSCDANQHVMGNVPGLRYCLSDSQCDNCSDNTISKHHCHVYMCVPFVL